jgi:hypothetical protein
MDTEIMVLKHRMADMRNNEMDIKGSLYPYITHCCHKYAIKWYAQQFPV